VAEAEIDRLRAEKEGRMTNQEIGLTRAAVRTIKEQMAEIERLSTERSNLISSVMQLHTKVNELLDENSRLKEARAMRGYAIVSVEPTQAILDAANEWATDMWAKEEDVRNMWKAMVEAGRNDRTK
jgi:hypothetical protein